MNERGFSLTESLLALWLMGIALTGVLSTFLTYSGTNTRNEERSGAVAVAQARMEALRFQDPVTMPSYGASSAQVVALGDREYEVVVEYCTVTSFCSTDSRHVVVEVSYGGMALYSVESVFTRLQ